MSKRTQLVALVDEFLLAKDKYERLYKEDMEATVKALKSVGGIATCPLDPEDTVCAAYRLIQKRFEKDTYVLDATREPINVELGKEIYKRRNALYRAERKTDLVFRELLELIEFDPKDTLTGKDKVRDFTMPELLTAVLNTVAAMKDEE